MPPEYRSCAACPFCESGELRFTSFLARCGECGGTISRGFFEALHQIRNLPEVQGRHTCECGHPEMNRLTEGGSRCPSCGGEVAPRIDHSP